MNDLFATSTDAIVAARAQESLDNFLPEGYETLQAVDDACMAFQKIGRLVIVSSDEILQLMHDIKNPSLQISEFRSIADRLIDALVAETVTHLDNPQSSKAVLSIRAGLAFEHVIKRHLPNAPFGFETQSRDHETLQPTSTGDEKLGAFQDAEHALVCDPMLATGGSMADLLQRVKARGAGHIVTLSMFSSPQGIVRIAEHTPADLIVSLPLEAGLSINGYIVGGHMPHTMLGDFGDRYYGSIG